MRHCNLLIASLLMAVAVSVGVSAAEALLKPLPQPDYSKMSTDAATTLRDGLSEFNQAKTNLVGNDLADAYAKIGAIYARAGQLSAADIAFYDAGQLNPNDGRYPYLRGLLALQRKDLKAARSLLQTAYAHDRLYVPIRYRLASVMMRQGDLESARKLMQETASKRGNLPATHAALAQIALKQKRYGEAVKQARSTLKLAPSADAMYSILAQAYAAQGNSKDAAAARARQGQNMPGFSDPLAKGLGRAQVKGNPLQRAATLMRAGRSLQARAALDELLKSDPNNVEALSLYARIQAHAGNLAAARSHAARALKADAGSGQANLSMGLVDEIDGKGDLARGYYAKAVTADGTLPEARLLLGNAQMRAHQYAAAARQYQVLLKMQPTNYEALARLAAAQVSQGHCEAALQAAHHSEQAQPREGRIAEVYVRVASTCPQGGAQKQAALKQAKELYRANPSGDISAALALASAANGQFREAQEYQAQAIFEAVSAHDGMAAIYREPIADFKAKRVPTRPWPADHPYFQPPLLTPDG